MDFGIADASLALSQQQSMSSVGTTVLGKSLDQMNQSGQMLVNSLNSMPSPSLESLVNPSVGSNIDVQV